MTAPLHLVRTRVDRRALAAFAAAHGVLDDDLGYALHLALRRRFGAAAPQPFRRLEADPRAERLDRLLGYAGDPGPLLQAGPGTGPAPSDPLPDPMGEWDDEGVSRLRAIFPEPFEARAMPEAWRTGQRLAFEVLARPVTRFGARARATRAALGRPSGGERDAFLAGLDARDASGGDRDSDPREREAAYRGWLASRLDAAAALDGMRLVSHRRSRVVRAEAPRSVPLDNDRGRSRGDWTRPPRRERRRLDGPESLLAGTLTIADPAAFAALLARGVGRHAAFGYGMMLLRPAGG